MLRLTMLLRPSLHKNYVVLICMALGLMLISYQLTGIRPSLSPVVLGNNIDSDDQQSQQPICTPKKNALFLKTHKTAGSTVQNIFMRYASQHDLLLVLPLKGNYLGHPMHFQPQMAPRLRHGYHYNILAHHARYNHRAIKALLPEDSVFVTILRDPVALFESLYAYYTLNATFGMDIVDFALANGTLLDHHNQRLVQKIGRNQMSYDLGLPVVDFDRRQAVLRHVQAIDRQFQLVMIAEMMDESLVLLRHLMCWSVDDVASFKHNARPLEGRVQLSGVVERRLRRWNGADQLMYDYFLERLRQRVAAFGAERMEREVSELRARSARWYDRCVANLTTRSGLDEKFRVYNKQVLGFRLRDDVANNATCRDMAKAELPFTKELQERQRPLLAVFSTPPTHVLYNNYGSRRRVFRDFHTTDRP